MLKELRRVALCVDDDSGDAPFAAPWSFRVESWDSLLFAVCLPFSISLLLLSFSEVLGLLPENISDTFQFVARFRSR